MKVYCYDTFSKKLEKEYIVNLVIYNGVLLDNYSHIYLDKFGKKQSYFHKHLSFVKLTDGQLEILNRDL